MSINILEVLRKKRDGLQLSAEEIAFVISGATSRSIPDYQVAALLMAICTKGMTLQETIALTRCMALSGSTMHINLRAESGRTIRVDKHSTGGVGDKVTMVLAPLLATFPEIAIAKLSGRALGYTGGTIDKLESIPGFKIQLTEQEIESQINAIGVSVSSPTSTLAPADHILYELRDVTSTVENESLICASVLSKKMAAGADIILLDVKYGKGALMKTLQSARQLAFLMIQVAQALNMRVCVALSDMDEPLGHNVGNLLEIQECMNTLKNHGPRDLTHVCIELCAVVLLEAGVCKSLEDARLRLETKLRNGEAHQKFVEWIERQGGDITALKGMASPVVREVIATERGWVRAIDADTISRVVFHLGAGRMTLNQLVNPLVGVSLVCKHGEHVTPGEAFAIIYAADEQSALIAEEGVRDAFAWAGTQEEVSHEELIHEILYSRRIQVKGPPEAKL